ncbi:FGGY-family carbohydrate kinase [Rubrolithibacter danxiaensis]|uniref:FGGY-family carbohydrate kinase n=1 Tax=Rubrolithibacter danxiaensis TaxID=3390805 RepID=UPI003BF8F71C
MMYKIPVIAIFDIGKTNKKLLLFSENYKLVHQESENLPETVDEDGFPCEDLEALCKWVLDTLKSVIESNFEIKAINFSTYGASFVYLDQYGKPLTPLYNYLKPYPDKLKSAFYQKYGGEAAFSEKTASPVLGSLNSGMQIYRLKYEKPELFKKTAHILHLPQYISSLITGKYFSDITSIGCHTNLWDFTKNDYHYWVKEEGILEKLAPIVASDSAVQADLPQYDFAVGVGLHDSSAAMIPYLNFHDSFVLISTGTWCISLNPFNHLPLTQNELQQDCLSYIQYKGTPVKASRLFTGYEHDTQAQRIAGHFKQNPKHFKAIEFLPHIFNRLTGNNFEKFKAELMNRPLQQCQFSQRDLTSFSSDTEDYHQLLLDLVAQQYQSTSLILKGTNVKRIFVDGGFSKNSVYMNLLTLFFPEMEIFATSMAQATAMGTALVMHKHWNNKPIQNDIIKLKYYSTTQHIAL